jgi:putative spermidine/putrescine transport system ATP-binding protein/spermidine/putrescine transport system ATP-binding protein
MSAADNVGYGLRMRRLAKHEVARRVADALALVRLSGIEDRRPHQLSGGQQQRVALARALVISPKVLLLDEPLSALDRSLRASMQVEIKEIQRQLGVTTLFVTHDQSEALSLSDRIAVMFDGQIRQIGSPAEIYRRPRDRFVASFVGDVNVLRARLGAIDRTTATVILGGQSIRAPSDPLAGCKPGAAADLFVRPEQLRLSETGEAVAVQGTVTAHIYQGGHVDLYVRSPVAAGGRLLVRSSEPDAITRWPVGTAVGVTVGGADALAFPPQDDKP